MPCSSRDRAVPLALAVAAASLAGAAQSADPIVEAVASTGTLVNENRLLMLPTVNGTEHSVALLVRDSGGRYYAEAQTLADWRIAPPYAAPVDVRGRQFYALDGFPGLSVVADEPSMTVAVTVPAQLLTGTVRSLAARQTASSAEGAFGVYLDYDVAYAGDEGLDAGLSSLLYPTLFTERGNLSATVLYHENGTSVPGATDWVRLDTAWSRDNPKAMRTLRVGDAVTPYGSWARSVHFGGVQVGTNFATRPDEITFPQPSIEGTAAVPSALDIFVNGSLRSRTDVPGGAFQIDDVPIVTGAGQIQVVTRDLLGREQLVTQDFYVSERLLKEGLNEYSVNAGALRENYGITSNEYGDFLVAGFLRRGLSDLLTIEGRVEGTADVHAAGVSIARAIGFYGVTSAAVAVSKEAVSGTLWQIGHEYLGRTYRASLRVQGSRDFAQPGLAVIGAWPERQITVAGGRNFGRQGSLGVSYIDERFADAANDRKLLTMSYSRSLSRKLVLTASISDIDARNGNSAATIAMHRTLGLRSSASSSVYSRGGDSTLRVDHRYELPAGPGYGYRTSVAGGGERRGAAEFAVNTEHAHYFAEYAQYGDASGWRLGTHGSLAMLEGELFAAREINEGFAVVDAGGYEGVRVFLENREIGTTNRRGRLLVPGLRPYQANRLRIESADLPLTARIDNDAMQVAPYYRSGAIASFGIEGGASALLRAVTEDGVALPEGARARIGDSEFRFPVGLDGRLYLQDVESGARVEISYGSAMMCGFTLPDLDAAAVGIPDLGEVLCR